LRQILTRVLLFFGFVVFHGVTTASVPKRREKRGEKGECVTKILSSDTIM